ncbi:iron-containing redox enzyme family protein (plasmid) [Streptomyces sp. NBC_00441]|uniref:iron-containing redox enzyme family protein n=1 Tax=Streptomyces sp. NBC_00441 TaxID=2975742 RepID=UPI002E28F60D|nr:iron-containing redox enzyme family protein [Streptomyces sp. NBC_00441]
MAGALPGSVLERPRPHGSAISAAFPQDASAPDLAARLQLMTRLHRHYAAYLGGPETFEQIPRLNASQQIGRIENEWLRWEDEQVDTARLPQSAAEFRDWFEAVSAAHVQPEFCRYIENEATLDEVALFFLAEELVDSRFDDLVALVQLGSAGASKLVMAENYWDEMGEGALERMHTVLFEHSAVYMRDRLAERNIDTSELNGTEVFENACLTLMYALHRGLVPRALGALGLMEHSAPPRFQAMVDACTRLGVPADVITYQSIHVHVDEGHGADWLDHVLLPLVQSSPAALREVCMGVLTRERVANAYYRRIWQQMKDLRR